MKLIIYESFFLFINHLSITKQQVFFINITNNIYSRSYRINQNIILYAIIITYIETNLFKENLLKF